jgi:hypothetical protein
MTASRRPVKFWFPGHHSTSDDSTRYRDAAEIREWREKSNPVMRLRKYLEAKGWWDEAQEKAAVAAEKKEVLAALTKAGQKPKPPLDDLASDVFDVVPKHLQVWLRWYGLPVTVMVWFLSCWFCFCVPGTSGRSPSAHCKVSREVRPELSLRLPTCPYEVFVVGWLT